MGTDHLKDRVANSDGSFALPIIFTVLQSRPLKVPTSAISACMIRLGLAPMQVSGDFTSLNAAIMTSSRWGSPHGC